MQIEPSSEPLKCSFSQAVLLEELGDHLQVPTARQVNRILVPALERLLLFNVNGIIDVLMKIDVVFNIVLLRVYVLPALKHESSLHQPARRAQPIPCRTITETREPCAWCGNQGVGRRAPKPYGSFRIAPD